MSSSALRGATILNALALAQIVLRLVSFVWLMRLLSPDAFGLAAIGIAIALMAGSMNDAGMTSALVRRSRPSRTLTQTVFWTQLSIGGVLSVAMIIGAPALAWAFGREDAIPIIQLAALSLIANGVAAVPYSLLQRAERFDDIARAEFCGSVFAVFLGGILAMLGAGPYAALSLFLVPTLLRALMLFLASGFRPRRRFSARALRSISTYSLSLLGEQLVSMVSSQFDRVLIGTQLGAPPLGVYHQAGQIFALPMQVLAWGTSAAFFPSFAKLKDNRSALATFYLDNTQAFVALVLPIYVGMAFIADPMLKLLLGAEASQTWGLVAPVIAILCVGGIGISVGNFNGTVCLSLGKPKALLWNAMLTLAMLVIFVSLGVRWGLVGAAAGVTLATLISHLALTLRVGSFLNIRREHWLRTLHGPFLATCVMTAVLLPLIAYGPAAPLPKLLLMVGLGSSIYAIALRYLNPTLFGKFWSLGLTAVGQVK